MAPTICSEKKQHQHTSHHHHHAQHCHHSQHHQYHQLRIKDLRRRVESSRNTPQTATSASASAPTTASTKGSALTNTTNHHHTTATTTAAVGSANVAASGTASSALTTSAASAARISPAVYSSSSPNIADFVVAKGAMNSATAAAAASAASLAWRQRRRGRCAEQLRAQISDNAVSSSTHMEDSGDVDAASDGVVDLSHRYMRANGTAPRTPLSPDSSTHAPAASSPTASPNESEGSRSYETGDSDATMDVDDVDGDAVKRVHSSSVRSGRQTVTVLKAKETKNGSLGCSGGGVTEYHQPNTNGLLGIAIKTIKLVQRNQLLQSRLTQLQMETSEFIASVLANPENRHFREKINSATKPAEPKQRGNMLLRH